MWWPSKLPKHLPLGQGPYAPACTDIMTGFSQEGTFIRLYYPSSVAAKETDPSKWTRWVPHEKYIEGFANIVNSWSHVIKMVVWLYGGEPMVPVMWESPVLSGDHKRHLPLIVYSHGFGATRFITSTIAAEMASRGFLFASIEHRDTSASATYYYESPEKRDLDERVWIPHVKMAFGPNHYEIRNKQVHERLQEVKRTIDMLESLNAGNLENVLPSSFDLTCFKDRIDLSSMCMMGHSFGGATTLLAMANDQRLKSGVVLDGWMFPIKEEKDMEIDKPLLFINTQTFHIESNLSAMSRFSDKRDDTTREIYTIKHTTHENQTDTPHVMGYWLNWFMHKLDPVVATNINNHLILRFLNRVTGWPESVSDCEEFLVGQKEDLVEGTYLYSKVPKRSPSTPPPSTTTEINQ